MRMNGKENGLTPLLAGKQHSVIRDSLPRHNSPKLIIRGHHPPRHPYKLPYLNRQWILGNKKTICLSKEKGEGSISAPFLLINVPPLQFHYKRFCFVGYDRLSFVYTPLSPISTIGTCVYISGLSHLKDCLSLHK